MARIKPEIPEAPQPGGGGCWAYKTKAGERWRARGPVQLEDGKDRARPEEMLFLTKTAGLDRLGDQQSAGRKGEFVVPSKQTLGQYGRDVIDGLRIGPQTRAARPVTSFPRTGE